MFDRSIPNNPNTQSPRFIHSIRGQFVLAFVLAVIIPAFIITTLTGVLGIQSGLNKASDQLNAITTLQEVRIGLYVDDLRNEVSRLTEDPAFLLLVRQALPNSLFPTRRDDARNQILAVFGTQLERSTLYTSLFVASLDGGVFVSSRDADVDRTFSDLSYFQSVPQGDYVLPPLYSSNIGDAPEIRVFVPVYDRGELLAVIGASANLTRLTEIVTEKAGLGTTGETYLVDSGRHLLTPTRDSNYPVGQTIVNTMAVDAALGQTTAGSERYTTFNSASVVGAYHYLPDLGVILVTEQNQSEILSSTIVTVIGSALITVIAVLIVIIAGVTVVERRITLPLVQLSETAKLIADGDLKLKVDISRDDEIGSLARTFNQMIASIQKRTQDLVRANALAQESARLKSEFLSTMSHELRTPLNAIIGFTGIMLQGMSGEIDDKARRMVERISSNGQRLLTLIDDVLNIARIESGRLELVREPFEPRVLADKLHSQLGGLPEQKGVGFYVTVADDVPQTLYGDEGRVSQIITNLLSNAFKFTSFGEVRLSFSWQDDSWVIRVDDTGIGIPPHAHNLIFEAFRQVDGSSRRVYGGSGLGLAIVRNLCVMMGGNVRVESSLGRGSSFIVSLPLLTSDLMEAAQAGIVEV